MEERQVVILGSGPSGLTAALYTARADLNPLVFEGETPGGQLTTTTEVENYPGFPLGMDGSTLVENIKTQAAKFGTQFKFGSLSAVDTSSRPFQLTFDGEDSPTVSAQTLIVATGASPRKLNIESEERYWSKGVTSCATCDGFFYKGRDVCVIGGGDSAIEEALFLTRFCPKVYIIHRRDEWRASKIMADRAMANEKIEVLWNSIVEEILGDPSVDGLQVNGVRLKNTETGDTRVQELGGVFLGIGHIPNTDFLKGVIDLDENGYAVTQPDSTTTSVEGLFVCGDAQDHVFRQAITAAGTGCMAAIEAERFLKSVLKSGIDYR